MSNDFSIMKGYCDMHSSSKMREVDVKRNRAKLLGEGQRTHDDVNILVEEKFDLYARLQAKLQLCNNTDAIGLFPETSSSFLLADPSAHYCNKHYAFGNCSRILADTMQERFQSTKGCARSQKSSARILEDL